MIQQVRSQLPAGPMNIASGTETVWQFYIDGVRGLPEMGRCPCTRRLVTYPLSQPHNARIPRGETVVGIKLQQGSYGVSRGHMGHMGSRKVAMRYSGASVIKGYSELSAGLNALS